MPVFAKELYGSVPSEVGWIATMAGFGGIAASMGVASLRAGQRRGWVILLSPVISAISIFVIGSFPWYWVGMIFFIGDGIWRIDPLGVGAGAGGGTCQPAIPRSYDEPDDDDLRTDSDSRGSQWVGSWTTWVCNRPSSAWRSLCSPPGYSSSSPANLSGI